MSKFTAKDGVYRRKNIKEAWDTGRAMNGDPTLIVHRYEYTGGDPSLGIEATRSDKAGFPKILDCNYSRTGATEVADTGGLFNAGTVFFTVFDFEFKNEDIIEFQNREYRIVQNEYDRALAVSRLYANDTGDEHSE